jgi:hypothetical protein
MSFMAGLLILSHGITSDNSGYFGSSHIFMVNGEVFDRITGFRGCFQRKVHPVDLNLYLIQKLSLFMPIRCSLRVNNLNDRASLWGNHPWVRVRFIAL